MIVSMMGVLDPRALNDSLEDVLHWACQSKEAKEVLVELLLPQLERKWDYVRFNITPSQSLYGEKLSLD